MRAMVVGAVIFSALAGCAGMPKQPNPEPRVVPIEAPRVVQQKCKDSRPPPDEYPDTDDKLAQFPDNDFEGLAKAYRAGRNLRDSRLLSDNVLIASCAGN